MQVAISTTRPFHSALLANALLKHGVDVRLYTSVLRRHFRGLAPAAQVQTVPSLLQTAMHFLHFEPPSDLLHADSWMFDHSVAALLRNAEICIGWATASLATAQATRRRGGRFVLDRACPYVDAQQTIIESEAARTGARYTRQPRWFRDRQIGEYEQADRILVPSEYTRRSFPNHLQPKLIKAPLFGRCAQPATVQLERNPMFTVGVVGGDPLRKGYLYLLQAWRQLRLPHARLLIRSSANFAAYPVLQELLRELPNVTLLPYVPDINDFYRQCDLFVLPSVDDGFGMALFEAMANAVPCIATTHCGAAELLTPGVEGLVVQPFSSDALAQAIHILYQSEERRQSVALAGQQRVAALGNDESSPLYEAAIGTLLRSLSSSRKACFTPA